MVHGACESCLIEMGAAVAGPESHSATTDNPAPVTTEAGSAPAAAPLDHSTPVLVAHEGTTDVSPLDAPGQLSQTIDAPGGSPSTAGASKKKEQ